jgi:hypothetical protein
MGIKLQESEQVIICAKADPTQQFDIQWISKHTKDWVIANVMIFDIDASQHGRKSKRIMITFDANTCEQSETTF